MDPSRRPQLVPTGWPAVDAVLHSSDPTELGQAELHQTGWGGLVRGAVHEWYGVGPASEGWSPPLFLLTHLARQAVTDALDRGVPDHVVWIGRNIWPYPRTLSHPVDVEVVGQAQYRPRLEASIALSEPEDAELKTSGSAAGRDLLMRSLFVATTTGRSSKGESSERLWAIDTALRCPSVTAVVADGSGLPMAATRRLQLAAASAGALVLLARPPEEVREISAATTRWTVTREAVPDTGVPPAGPCWRLALMRAKGAQKVIHKKNRHRPTPLLPLHKDRGTQPCGAS